MELMEQMCEKLRLTWEDLLKQTNASEYAMGVLTIDGDVAEVAFYESGVDSLQATTQITWKQFDQSDPNFNLSPSDRQKAGDAFVAWAEERGYKPKISPSWARPPEP